MMRIFFIRHGETDFNAERRYCGFSDPALNEKGISRAEKMAENLKNLDVKRVYSSDLKRAAETAEIIFGKHLIEKTEDFREINFGEFEGLKHEELLKKYPGPYTEWLNDPGRARPPNGESIADVKSRVINKLSRILKLHKTGPAAIVSHGGPIKIILGSVLNFSPKDLFNIPQDVGALNVVEYPVNSNPEIIRLNDVSP